MQSSLHLRRWYLQAAQAVLGWDGGAREVEEEVEQGEEEWATLAVESLLL